VGATSIGLLYLLAGVVSLPVQVGGGHLSDLWGRRTLLLAGTVASAAGCLTLAVAPTAGIAVIGVVLMGVGFAIFFPLYQATAADLTDPAKRERVFAWTYAALGAGWTLGPALGGWLAGWFSYTFLFALAAAELAVAVLPVMVSLPETAPREHARSSSVAILNAWQDRSFLLLSVLIFGIWLVGGQLLVTLPLWVVGELHNPASLFGVMMAFNGLLIAVGQVGVIAAVRKLPPAAVMALGALGFGLGYGLMALPWVPTLIAASAIFTLGEMLLVPTINAAVDRLAAPSRRGQYQGAAVLVQGVAFSAGPVIGGTILQNWGGPALWGTCLAWGILCAAGFAALGRWLSSRPVSSSS
jgi:MFS family permease